MGLKNFGFYYKINNCINDIDNKCIVMSIQKLNHRNGRIISSINRVYSYKNLNIEVNESNLYEIAYKLFKSNCFSGLDIFEKDSDK